MRERIAAILGVFVVLLSAVECGLPFVYTGESSSDPKMVALLREALMHAGVSPDGINLKSILSKFEFFRTSYKATYINQLGQTCYLKWRVNEVVGTQSPKLPICSNLATGSGYEVATIGPYAVRPAIVGQPVWRPASVVPSNFPGRSENDGGSGTTGHHYLSTTLPPHNAQPPTYGPGRPTNRPGRPTYRPGRATNRPGRPTYRPGRPTYSPGRPSYRPGRPTYRPGGKTHPATTEPSNTPPNISIHVPTGAEMDFHWSKERDVNFHNEEKKVHDEKQTRNHRNG